jgi:hypothetical protein
MDDRLRLLFGSNRPELTCEECFAELPRYVELETIADRPFGPCERCDSPDACAAGRACARLRAHLQGCPACREEHEVLRELVLAEGADDS